MAIRDTKTLDTRDPGACEVRMVNVDAVREARAAMPGSDALAGMSAVFAAMADPTRLRMIAALDARELCVCDLAAVVGQSESAVSHQLRTLRGLGLVRGRKQGRMMFYALDDEHVRDLYRMAREHLGHQPGEGS